MTYPNKKLDEMCSTITLPKDYKPENVMRWIKKVSQNELKIIYDEIRNIKLNSNKLKRLEKLSIESLEAYGISLNSQKSETSSKLDTEKCMKIHARKTPRKAANIITHAEDNSACSKTSSNTKPSPNVVRIPLNVNNKTKNVEKSNSEVPFYMRLDPKLISITPGKSFTVRFDKSESEECSDPKPK